MSGSNLTLESRAPEQARADRDRKDRSGWYPARSVEGDEYLILTWMCCLGGGSREDSFENRGAIYNEHFALEAALVRRETVGEGRHSRPDPDHRCGRLVRAYGLRGLYVPRARVVLMSRVPPMPSPAPPPPDAEKPREVCRYRGMQVMDDRDRILVVVDGELPRGAAGGLRIEGFRQRSRTTWEAPHSPMSIMAAQAIGKEWFGEADRA